MLRLSNLIHLYRVRLRQRLVQELLAVVGIAIGVALVFAALVANTSLVGSVEQLTHGIVGTAQYEVAGRGGQGIDRATVARVAAVPGVIDAAPVLEQRVILNGPSGSTVATLVGGDRRLAQLGGALVRNFAPAQLTHQETIAVPGPMARSIGAAFGSRLQLETESGTTTTVLGAQLQASDIGGLVHSPVVISSLNYAQGITGRPGQASRVFVRAEPGLALHVKEALRAIVGHRLDVRASTADIGTFREAAIPTNQSTALFSVFAALVGFLFAISAVLLTVPQRRRLITDLRLAGHPPTAVVQVMLFDALMLGLVGSLLGLVLGDILSRQIFSSVPGYLTFAFPIGAQRIVTWQSAAVPFALGLVAACVAVLAPLRAVLGQRPELEGEKEPRWRTGWLLAGGLVTLAASLLVVHATPRAAAVSMVLLTVSLLLCLPAFVQGAVGVLGWAGRYIKSAVPVLAAMELRSTAVRARTFALAGTGAIALFASVAIGGAHSDLLRGLDASSHQIDGNASVWVTFPGVANAFATAPMSIAATDVARVSRVPGVASVGLYRGGFLDVGNRRVWVLGPPRDAPAPIPTEQIREGAPVIATRHLRASGWVTVSQALADARHVTVGDRIHLATPVPIVARIAAVTTNLGWPPGAIVLNSSDYGRAWGSRQPSGLLVRANPGVRAETLVPGVQKALAGAPPVNVEAEGQREQRHRGSAREGLSRLTEIAALVLGAAVLAMATAMAGVLWQRRATVAGLKVDGFTEFQLWRALILESGLLLAAGCIVGAAFGLIGQVVLGRGLVAVTGFPVFYVAGVGLAIEIILAVTAVSLVVLTIPGYLSVRVPPAVGRPT